MSRVMKEMGRRGATAALSRNFHFDIPDAHSIHPRAYIATAFSPHGSGTPLRKQDPPPPGFSKTRNCLWFSEIRI